MIPGLCNALASLHQRAKVQIPLQAEPNARFSMTRSNSRKKCVASSVFAMDKGLQEHQIQTMLEKLESQLLKASSIKYQVKTTELNGRSFINFTQLLISQPIPSKGSTARVI